MNTATHTKERTTMQTQSFTIRGMKIRSRTPRRFLVVAVRPEPVTTEGGTYLAFATIEKRTDSITTARTFVRWMCNRGRGIGVAVVVIDTTTGEEV